MRRSILFENFYRNLRENPHQEACVSGDRRVSRLELESDILRVSSFFSAHAPKDQRQPRIAIQTTDDYATLATILAGLRSGVTFIPINPAWPEKRVASILERTRPNWLLCDEGAVGGRDVSFDGARRVTFAELTSWERSAATGRFERNEIAYILFTSGSTGIPKGVPIPYPALEQFARHCDKILCNSGGYHRILAFHEFTFDLSIVGWLLMLLGKGAVHFFPPKAGVLALARYIHSNQISVLSTVPSSLSLLQTVKSLLPPNGLPSLKVVGICGATLFEKTVADLRRIAPAAEIFNLYGPTEATVWCSLFRVGPSLGLDSVPIGSPLPGTLFLFDRGANTLSSTPGDEGELLIAGAQLMRGYLDEEVTGLEKVCWDGAPTVAYRSGDYFREENGHWLFTGRKAGFVKTAGYRVSPSEVEEVFANHPGISECAVVAVPDTLREMALVLCYSAKVPLDDLELRSFGADKLPDYALPQRILHLEGLPKTDAQKIDYKAVRNFAELVSREYQEP